VWVYWTKDLDAKNKAVVLEQSNCKRTKHVVDLPSVIKVGKRLAILYDGLAWLGLPLRVPAQP
jgi:hypothetical protein